MKTPSRIRPWVRAAYRFALVTALSGCGGGSSSPPPPPPPPTYAIGGSVSGLIGSVVMQNNGGNDLTVSADGGFSFAGRLLNNANYSVTVLTQPQGQTCEVGAGTGAVAGGDVSTVTIACRPANPVLSITGREIRVLRINWQDVTGETEYRLLEDRTGTSGFGLRGILGADSDEASVEIYIPDFTNAQFMVQACIGAVCYNSNIVAAAGALNDAVGYAKPLDPDINDSFGTHVTSVRTSDPTKLSTVVYSDDGRTLVIGAPHDDSAAIGIGGNAADDGASDSGAVYVLNRVGPGAWGLQAYIKSPNAEAGDEFGSSVSISDDGNSLAVSASMEDSSSTGVGGSQDDNAATNSGAVYVYSRDEFGVWSFQTYLKASNTGAGDAFGHSVALSGNGNLLAVAAPAEDSNGIGVDSDQGNDLSIDSGAVYVFGKDNSGNWVQRSYLKASNAASMDSFGWAVDIDAAGDTLVVSAKDEDSAAFGINGSQVDNSSSSSGAVYVFDRNALDAWVQQAYIKASNTGIGDIFGWSIALSGDGTTLAVGAPNEDGGARGINGNQISESAQFSGAAYVFVTDFAGTWLQQAYIKSSNSESGDVFGVTVDLSADGSSLVVSAPYEDSDAQGVNVEQASNLALDSGAVFAFHRDVAGTWSQTSYIKAPNGEGNDEFGISLDIAGDGKSLAIGSNGEDGGSPSGGDRADNAVENAGAVYLY